jgi:hypothetical protein
MLQELKEQANKLKADGNESFKSGGVIALLAIFACMALIGLFVDAEYDSAVELYSEALKLYPSRSCEHEIAVCCANRAACHMKKVRMPHSTQSHTHPTKTKCTMSYLCVIVVIWPTSNG